MLLCVYWLHVSVCICVCWGRGQVKEVEPGWSAVHDNRWKVWTHSLGLEAAPSLLIVRETHDAAKWLQQRISQASSTSFSPADFLLITSAQDHGALGQTIYGPLISQVPVKSALLAVLVWCCNHAGARERQGLTERGSLCIDKQHRWMRLNPLVSTVSMSTVRDRHLTSFLPAGCAMQANRTSDPMALLS